MEDIVATSTEMAKNTNKLIEWFQGQIPNMISFGITILVALFTFWIGKKIVKLLLKLLKRNFERMNMEDGVIRFLMSLCKVALNILLIVIVAQILGFETSSVIALVGSAGLAIGLALQGSLANFAGGVLILIMKPFVMGDYIVYGDKEGTVVSIDIIYTRLMTPDNRKVTLPNGALANSDVINVTSEEERRLDLNVSVDYSTNIKTVKDVLEKILKKNEKVLQEKGVEVFVNKFEASAIDIGFRVWCKKENFWGLRCQLMEEVKRAFDQNQIDIPYEHLNVNINNVDTKQ